MKKLLYAVLLLVGLSVNSHAYYLGDLFNDTVNFVKDRNVFLEEARSGFIMDVNEGSSHSIQKMPFFNIDEEGIICADVGYVHNVDNQEGTASFGGSFKIDKFFYKLIPGLGEAVNNTNGKARFMRYLWVGFDGYRRVEQGKWGYGPSAGIKIPLFGS